MNYNYIMLFLLIFLSFEQSEYSLMKINLFKQNPLDYQGAIIRESEFGIISPLYFYLKEYHFFKTEKQRIIPYQIKFEWDMGLKKQNRNSSLRIVYNHVCNHGIDHPGIDRRQWNQLAIKIDLWKNNFYLKNSAGYVVSPFGPKRKNNNYNWIFFHGFGFKKDFGYFYLSFNIELKGFMEISSLKYSSILKVIITNGKFITGSGFERNYGLNGINSKAISLYDIFVGIREKLPDFKVSYGYLFKNPIYSFFSDFIVKYKIYKNLKILTNLKTVSPPKTQQPRFYDYKIGLDIDFKKTNLYLYHRERRDGNLFDGRREEINSFALSKKFKFKDFLLQPLFDYAFKVKDYPFRTALGLKIQKLIYEWKNFPLRVIFDTDFTYFSGKNKKGGIFEYGPSLIMRKNKNINLSFRQRVVSCETFEHYGIFEQRFFISIKFEKNKGKD